MIIVSLLYSTYIAVNQITSSMQTQILLLLLMFLCELWAEPKLYLVESKSGNPIIFNPNKGWQGQKKPRYL